MPSEGVELSPEPKLLTNDEVLRLATLFVRNGVTKIRITGGEPTVRKGILDIVSGFWGSPPLRSVSEYLLNRQFKWPSEIRPEVYSHDFQWFGFAS